MVWIWEAAGEMLNSGLLSERAEEACLCWIYISRMPSNLLIFRGQIYTHLALCKLCFHILKIEVGNSCLISWAEGYSLKEILGATISPNVFFLDFYICANTASFLLRWFPCDSVLHFARTVHSSYLWLNYTEHFMWNQAESVTDNQICFSFSWWKVSLLKAP